MSNDSQRKDAMNNPYSKKSIDFVDLFRSIDTDFLEEEKKEKGKVTFIYFLFIKRLTINSV